MYLAVMFLTLACGVFFYAAGVTSRRDNLLPFCLCLFFGLVSGLIGLGLAEQVGKGMAAEESNLERGRIYMVHASTGFSDGGTYVLLELLSAEDGILKLFRFNSISSIVASTSDEPRCIVQLKSLDRDIIKPIECPAA